MPPVEDLFAVLPELWLIALGLVLLGVDLVVGPRRKDVVGWVAVAGLVIALLPAWGLVGTLVGAGRTAFSGSYAVDGFAIFFKFIAIISTALVILAAMDYFRAPAAGTAAGAGPAATATPFEGEVYALLVFTAVGLLLMAASADLILLALAIELVSLTSYVLAGYLKGHPKSNEAGLKYFLFGAAASATMFYGFSFLYGLTGSTNLYVIAERAGQIPVPILTVSLALMLAGFGFKISMVPFHQWTPDVYEGAPTPVAAFLSVASKAAGFAVLLRVVVVAVAPSGLDWVALVAGLSAVSMFLGNLLALPQRNIKRMLAYSSISHAGFILIGVAGFASGGVFGGTALLVYLFQYVFTNLGAFFVAALIGSRLGSDDIPDYAGLAQRAPALAFLMALFMLSLTGIPPTAGFFAKLAVFGAALERSPDLLWLVAVGVINSVISLFYYVGVIRAMYLMPAADPSPVRQPAAMQAALWIAGVGTLALGIFPGPVISLARTAALLLP
ncbi:MAG: NADH-quinone oxidoreductase subunit N [Armatimonadetes bacterium]|nr:NADH-quinone oxidoreductase subunit N [Armatimonadota bacterium]